MEPTTQSNEEERARNRIYSLINVVVALAFILSAAVLIALILRPGFFTEQPSSAIAETEPIDRDLIENGIHVRTGLIDAEGLMTVVNNCTNCHSAKLLTQNRMSADRWNETILWMQQTQNLWELGSNQEVIVNYLVTNYPPKKKGRRMILSDIEWYELED